MRTPSTKLSSILAVGVALLFVLGVAAAWSGAEPALRLAIAGIGLGMALLVWAIFVLKRHEAAARGAGGSEDLAAVTQAEQALRESETRFRSLTELS